MMSPVTRPELYYGKSSVHNSDMQAVDGRWGLKRGGKWVGFQHIFGSNPYLFCA
jgi:hypothetical protein